MAETIGPIATDRAQQVLALAPEGTRTDLLVEIVIHLSELSAEPLNVLAELLAQWLWRILDRRGHQPMPFGGQHLLQLSTPPHECRQRPRRGIRQRSYFGLDRLAEVRQNLRVQTVGLGQLPSCTCEIPHLAWIGDDHRQLLGAERRGRAGLEAAGGSSTMRSGASA